MINDNVCGNCKTYEKQVWAANWTPEQRLKMHNCQLVNCEENVTLSISFPFCYLFTSLVPLPTDAKQHAEGRNDEPVREKLKITKTFLQSLNISNMSTKDGERETGATSRLHQVFSPGSKSQEG